MKYFNKDNFIYSSFSDMQKRQSLFITICLMVMFLFSGFTFFNALYCFADCIGSIVSGSMDVALWDLTRSIPIILSCIMSIWGILLFHASYRNVDNEKRIKSLKKNGIALITMGGVNILYVFIAFFIGRFSSLVEGSPSPIYPLDAILYSLLFVAIGIFTLVYVYKLSDKYPYVVPSRGPVVTKARGLYCTFMAFWMLIAIFAAGGFFVGLFTIDFLHGYQFYSVMLLIAFFLSFFYMLVWEFYYNQLKEEKRKEFLLPLGIGACALSIVVTVLYFVALAMNLDGPGNMGFGVLPVAFAASVNIATMLVVLTPLIVSIVVLIKGLKARK